MVNLALLGGFCLAHQDQPLTLPFTAQRVLAALATVEGPVERSVLAMKLWPDRRRMGAGLRNALWRIGNTCPAPVVLATRTHLRLHSSVRVDLAEALGLARRLVVDDTPGSPGPGRVLDFERELLPSWTDEWLLLPREQWNQLRLHALERLAGRLAHQGRYASALESALAAVAIEPYRESAHRIVIQVHLAEGNCASALAQYRRYRAMLQRDLGVEPTAQIRALVDPLTVG